MTGSPVSSEIVSTIHTSVLPAQSQPQRVAIAFRWRCAGSASGRDQEAPQEQQADHRNAGHLMDELGDRQADCGQLARIGQAERRWLITGPGQPPGDDDGRHAGQEQRRR